MQALGRFAPAARIHGNVVHAPEGRALVLGLNSGAALVESNQLHSQGDDAPPRDYFGPGTDVEITVASQSASGRGAVVDILAAAAVADWASSTQAVTVNSEEFDVHPEGRVVFNDNQVCLDWEGKRSRDRIAASVVINSTFGVSDVSVERNQFLSRIDPGAVDPGSFIANDTNWTDYLRSQDIFAFPYQPLMVTHLLAVGRSVNVKSNRFIEGEVDAAVSAITYGAGVSKLHGVQHRHALRHCRRGHRCDPAGPAGGDEHESYPHVP